MGKLGAKAHIAIGLAFLVASVMLAAEFLGLLPDRAGAVRSGRIALVETLAAASAELGARGDIERLAPTLRLAVKRNEDMLSAALRARDGQLVVEIGPHATHWQLRLQDASTDADFQVPIMAGRDRWGTLEVRFTPVSPDSVIGWLMHPVVVLVGFVFFAALFVFYFYLGKVLRHLDPSGAVPSRVRNALDTLTEGLLVLDRKQTVVLANRAFARFAGQESSALLGVDAAALAWTDNTGELLARDAMPWARALLTGESQVNNTVCLRGADGAMHTFQINCAPVLTQSNKPGGVLVSLDDITALEEYSHELKKAKNDADAANRAKSDFLANMSHEIRTPMNAILGFTEVLRRGYSHTDAAARRHLNTIHASGTHLLELINDILDLSKVESGHLEVESIDCAPYALAHQVVQAMSVKAQEKQVALRLEADGLIPETIQSDPARLRQILTNLVGNALKFTDSGSVTVRLALEADADAPRLRFDVIDTGIGITQEKIAAVFDPFVQADSSVNRRFGGTGLGLAISRRFAHALGGDIVATSAPGQGSTFSATVATGDLEGVRMRDADALQDTTESIEEATHTRWAFPASTRILVVDDGDENRELIATVLREYGVTPDEAQNGQIAVDKARAANYDIILMDMQMPVMDGFTATRSLREAGCTTPIVALTANAMHGYEQEVIAAGCTAYLTKPVDIDALLSTVAGMVGGRRERARAQAAEPTSTPTPTPTDAAIHSRLADHPRMQAIVGRFIARLHETLPAFAKALAEGDFAELGRLAHWLKGAGGTVGFDLFTEPAGELELAANDRDRPACARYLSVVTDYATRLVLAAPPSGQAQAVEHRPATTFADAASREAICSTLAGNARLHGVITKFIARMQRQAPEFEVALKARNFDSLAAQAHWLKGAAGTVGFHQFTDPANALEVSARQQDVSDCHEALSAVLDLTCRMRAPDIAEIAQTDPAGDIV